MKSVIDNPRKLWILNKWDFIEKALSFYFIFLSQANIVEECWQVWVEFVIDKVVILFVIVFNFYHSYFWWSWWTQNLTFWNFDWCWYIWGEFLLDLFKLWTKNSLIPLLKQILWCKQFSMLFHIRTRRHKFLLDKSRLIFAMILC